MAEETTPGGNAAAANGQGQNVALQSVYVKDLSFEAPNGPFLPAQSADPKIKLNLNTSSTPVGTDVHEVLLTVTLEAKSGDTPVYLAEVKQGGVFTVRGFGGIEVARSEVRMPAGPIRMVGEHHLSVHLHADVDVEIVITVVAEE